MGGTYREGGGGGSGLAVAWWISTSRLHWIRQASRASRLHGFSPCAAVGGVETGCSLLTRLRQPWEAAGLNKLRVRSSTQASQWEVAAWWRGSVPQHCLVWPQWARQTPSQGEFYRGICANPDSGCDVPSRSIIFGSDTVQWVKSEQRQTHSPEST